MSAGVLPFQTFKKMVKAGCIEGIPKKYLSNASIDLPLSAEAFRLESIFVPLPGESIRSILDLVGAEPHDLAHPLEVDVPYIIRIEGTWKLPPTVYGYANPKSSVGRNNVFCRVVADGVDKYDALLGPGWAGEMWVLVRANSFPVLVGAGLPLVQMRFFDGVSFLDRLETDLLIQEHGLLFSMDGTPYSAENIRRHADSFILSLYVGERMGFECRGTRRVLDLTKTGIHDPADFFQRIEPKNGKLILRKGSFYILATNERVMIPPSLAGELRAIDPRLGEFRSHAAGYIDPGWGWGREGEAKGRPIVLEVIPFEDTLVRPGQAIARLRYERMKAVPERIYDTATSSYTGQQMAVLSKHFRDWE